MSQLRPWRKNPDGAMLAYVIRHAQSLGNAGQDAGLNSGLSTLGVRQTHALAERFEHVPVTAIYSSPFLRSIQTAVPIAERLGLPVRIRPELCEFHHLQPGTKADMELDDLSALTARHPRTVRCPDYQGPFDWPAADEPFDQLVARMRSLATGLKARWTDPDDTVVLVSHGTPIARLIEAWLTDAPGPSWRFAIDNATIAALRYHEQVSSLVCLNDVTHLMGLPFPENCNFRKDGSVHPHPDIGHW